MPWWCKAVQKQHTRNRFESCFNPWGLRGVTVGSIPTPTIKHSKGNNMTDNYYIIATNALGPRQYFAGRIEENFIAPALVLTTLIFDAYDFKTKKAAKKCMKHLGFGDEWEISECSSGVSDSLKPHQSKETS
jgi:hypothetical protein